MAPLGACKAIGRVNLNADAALTAEHEILMVLVAYDAEDVILGAAQQSVSLNEQSEFPANPAVELDLENGSDVAKTRLFVFEKTANGGLVAVTE